MADPGTPADRSPNGSRPVGRTVGIVAAVVLLVAAVITAMWVFTADPLAESSTAQEALGYIPSDATRVEIRAQQEIEQRLGIDDVDTGADEAQIDRYLEKAVDNPFIQNRFTEYLPIMNEQGAAFTALDVNWSASVAFGSVTLSPGIELFGMDAAIELDQVADDMVDAGWRDSEIEGGRLLEVNIAELDPLTRMRGAYPATSVGLTAEVVVLPNEHLMVTGDYERVLDVVAGDSDSLQAADDVSELLGADEDPEYVHLARGGELCADVVSRLLGSRPSPELLDKIRQEGAGLATPTATASLVLADGDGVTTTSRLLFADADEAADDKEARERYLRDGTSFVTRTPIADRLTVDSITVDGTVETITYTLKAGLLSMSSAIYHEDFAPTFCLDL